MAGELITADGQIEYAGLLLGKGTQYGWSQLDGWEDMPDVDVGDVLRPAAHGAWPGEAYSRERVVTLRGRLRGVGVANLRQAVTALRSALRVGDEQPLTVRTAGGEMLTATGRVTQRVIPVDLAHAVGSPTYAVQWICSDPRRYSTVQQHATASLPVASGTGLAYPLAYPLDYGPTPTSSSTVSVTNGLDEDTQPLLVVRGPLEGPLIVNALTGVQLEFDIVLADVDTLTVDCAAGTVLLNGEADRLYTRTAASAPVEMFTIAPGTNPIELRALTWDAGNQLDIYWQDATL